MSRVNEGLRRDGGVRGSFQEGGARYLLAQRGRRETTTAVSKDNLISCRIGRCTGMKYLTIHRRAK